jgi:precorrin-6A/cobalt-precorrin-6A reductase
VLSSRGPYTYDGEYALMREHRIDALVTKNSGGELTRAKLEAATALGIDVVMIDRPPLPGGIRSVDSVSEAVSWVLSRDSAAG